MKKTTIFCTLLLSLCTLAAHDASAQAKKPAANSASGFQHTKTGLEYKIIRKTPATGVSPKLGDFVEMHIKVSAADSLLFDSRKVNGGQPVSFPIQKPAFTSDPVQGFMMMKPGDSAIFYVLVDSLKGQQMPPFLKSGDKLAYNVRLVSVKSAAEGKADAEKKQAETKAKADEQGKAQMGIDDKLLQDYFAKNNIKPSKTASGVYYIINQQGTGESPAAGQTVTVNYTGKTMDGKTFDSNVDSNFHHVQPFTFTLGKHQVISGWDEGIPMIKKGGKGTLYIPSPMAYGTRSPTPAIPQNGILVFDVEVTDAK